MLTLTHKSCHWAWTMLRSPLSPAGRLQLPIPLASCAPKGHTAVATGFNPWKRMFLLFFSCPGRGRRTLRSPLPGREVKTIMLSRGFAALHPWLQPSAPSGPRGTWGLVCRTRKKTHIVKMWARVSMAMPGLWFAVNYFTSRCAAPGDGVRSGRRGSLCGCRGKF